MQVSLVGGSRLDEPLLQKWRELQAANPDLASPYFSPEFTQAVSAVREDVEVAVISEGMETKAFFPFQRSPASIGIPVGGTLSDYQGLICRPEFNCDPRELIRKCGLLAWDFDHLLTSQNCFAEFHRYWEPSPHIDLSDGFRPYAARCSAVKREEKKADRLQRDVGPLRFVAHSTDMKCLQQVLEWKSQQYIASSKPDLFALDWPRPLLELIHATQTAEFSGMLSLLYAGDRLIAGHFGMRSRSVWHHWFPSYDPEVGRYSPGLLLLLRMAESAPLLDVQSIDFGKGMTEWKERFMNGSLRLASGSVELPSLLLMRRMVQRTLRAAVAKSPLAGPARTVVRWAKGSK